MAVTVLMTRDLGVNKTEGSLAHGSCGIVGTRDSVDTMTRDMTWLYWGGPVIEEGPLPPNPDWGLEEESGNVPREVMFQRRP